MYMTGITSELAKKSVGGLRGDNFRRDNIAGPHGRWSLNDTINVELYIGVSFVFLH